MTALRFRTFGWILLLLLCTDCHSQTKKSDMKQTQVDRKPAVAGSFYPAKGTELADSLKLLFQRAKAHEVEGPVRALVVPHAGYVYSGEVAASGFNQIEAKQYKNIFVIGSSHQAMFEGAAVFTSGNFITPLGIATVDGELGRKLIRENRCFVDLPNVHLQEHSLEVEVPFLQHLLGNDLHLVPILLGHLSRQNSRAIALSLKPYFTDDNLFVVSTDLSHYPKYADGRECDARVVEAIRSNSPETFLRTVGELESQGIEDLKTAICGWTSVQTLLNVTEGIPGVEYRLIDALNSGDTPWGDKASVVGYAALAVVVKPSTEEEEGLTTDEKKLLLRVARQTLEGNIINGKIPDVDAKGLSPGTVRQCGAFVTLTKDGALRGCIGNFVSEKPLYLTVQEMTVAASTRDSRFEPVTTGELSKIDIEISVLSPLRKIASINEIVLGRDGIYIRKGIRSGTFLPQVATETGWSKEEFLGHCARDKAGIGWDGWKEADIFVYRATVFGENDVGR